MTMLHIENIDAYSVRFGSAYGGGTYYKILPKNMEAEKDELDRINIYHSDKKEQILHHYVVSDITLNGIVYSTAAAFVVAFNTMLASSTAYTTTTTTAAVTTTTTAPVTTTTTTAA